MTSNVHVTAYRFPCFKILLCEFTIILCTNAEHQNFFGVDENIGPVAISLKRERIPDEISEFYGASLTAPKYQHRVIMRTSQVIV